MRTIKEWLAHRRAVKQLRIALEEQEASVKRDAAIETLRNETEEVIKSLEAIGFKCSTRYSADDDRKRSTVAVVAPNNNALRLIVYSRGGYRIETL